jgi:hypothetical protein
MTAALSSKVSAGFDSGTLFQPLSTTMRGKLAFVTLFLMAVAESVGPIIRLTKTSSIVIVMPIVLPNWKV